MSPFVKAQDSMIVKIDIDLEKKQRYQLQIDGDYGEGPLKNHFRLVPGVYRLTANSIGYITKDTLISVDLNNTVIRIPLSRSASYLIFKDEIKEYYNRKVERVWIPVVFMTAGYGTGASLMSNSLRFQARKSKLQREYNSAGPDIDSIEGVKSKLEKLKANTIAQRKAAFVTLAISVASTFLVDKSIRSFNNKNEKPIYNYLPELSIEMIDSKVFLGLAYKFEF